METQLSISSNIARSNQTLTFSNCYSLTPVDGENVFVPPKRFPVYCGICSVPIRDVVSLKKHRAIKKHYCRDYPTSYQKQQGFVKKDYRKCWRRERTKFNSKVPTSQSTETPKSHEKAPVPASSVSSEILSAIVGSKTSVFPSASEPQRMYSNFGNATATTTTTTAKTITTTTTPTARTAVSVTTSSLQTDVINLHDSFNSSSDQSTNSEEDLAYSRPSVGEPTTTKVTPTPKPPTTTTPHSESADDDTNMDATPSASPFQPFHAVVGTMGGYFTYSKQNSFVKEEPRKNGAMNGAAATAAVAVAALSTHSSFEPRTHPSLPREQQQQSQSISPTTTTEDDAPLISDDELPPFPIAVGNDPVDNDPVDNDPVDNNNNNNNNEETQKFLNQLRAFREERFLTDIFLVVEEKKVFAHKIVLSAKSSFFKDLIDKCVNTPSYGLRLDFGFSHDAFLIALDFMYGTLSKEKIDSRNAENVKAVAQKLELDGLKSYSERVLLDTNFELAPTATAAEVAAAPAPVVATEVPVVVSESSPFNVETSLAELSNICADFTATALDGDQLVDFDDVVDDESHKPDPPLSSVDVSRTHRRIDFNTSGSVFNNDYHHQNHPARQRTYSQSTMMTPNPHLDGDSEMLGGMKNDFLSSSGFDEDPFDDDLFNFAANSNLFGSPVFNGAYNNPFDFHQQKTAPFLSPKRDSTMKPPQTNISISSSPAIKYLSLQAPPPPLPQPPVPTQPPPLPPPLPPPQQQQNPPSTREFAAMLSTQYSAKETPQTKPFMNCIICNDAVEGQTKIEQWIKLCQHLAEKHKKVIDREILTKQFGIRDSAITSSVFGGESGTSQSHGGGGGTRGGGNLVIKAPLHVKPAEETMVRVTPSTSASVTTEENNSDNNNRSKHGETKAKLSRFLSQKKILHSELMVHVKKIYSSNEERYGCLRCGKEFESVTSVQRHLVVNHNVPLPGLQILMCSNCGNKDVDRDENLSETGPSKSCNVCKHRMSRIQD